METGELILIVTGLSVLIIYGFLTVRKLKEQNRLIRNQSREIALKNGILNEQNQRLIELNLEKNQIIGVVSHDLKSPFNRVFALTNLIKMDAGNLTQEQLDYIDRIHQVVSESLYLIRNLLDIRSIEDKGIDIKIEKLNIVKYVNSLVKTYQTIADKKDIKIHLESKLGEESFDTDKQYLLRITENILSNAIKFTRKGGEVRILISEQEDAFSISIKDQGPGISETEQQMLYQKFKVLSSQATGGEGSTGLGLSIVKSLVERLGGKVWCESVLGEGSTFSFTLPKNPEI